MASTCADHIAEPLRTGGDVHRCTLPAAHVFDDSRAGDMDRRAHRCDCGAWWYDVQQVDEAATTVR